MNGQISIMYVCTYKHNWPLLPFSQDYGLASHDTHFVCGNFIRECRVLQLNVASKRLNFWETFSWHVYLLSEFLPEICWEKIAEDVFFFIFRFDDWPDIWTRALTSNKPIYYLLGQFELNFRYRIRNVCVINKFVYIPKKENSFCVIKQVWRVGEIFLSSLQ